VEETSSTAGSPRRANARFLGLSTPRSTAGMRRYLPSLVLAEEMPRANSGGSCRWRWPSSRDMATPTDCTCRNGSRNSVPSCRRAMVQEVACLGHQRRTTPARKLTAGHARRTRYETATVGHQAGDVNHERPPRRLHVLGKRSPTRRGAPTASRCSCRHGRPGVIREGSSRSGSTPPTLRILD